MSIELLQAMARYLAKRKLAEGGKEAVLLDRLKGAASRLPSLFVDWKLDFASQEEMLCLCLGFQPRDRVLQPMMVPVLPDRPAGLRQFLASKPAIMFETAGPRVLVGTSDPLLAAYQSQLSVLVGHPVDLVYLTPDEVEAGRRKLSGLLAEVVIERKEEKDKAQAFNQESGPVVQLVDLTITEAIQRKASDIHVEPMEKYGQVRYRIDGVLTKARDYAIELHSAITSRMKLIAGMDIAERRVPQDGRIRYEGHGADVDLRVSSIPTSHGESIVMRLLQRSSARVDLAKAGFRPRLFEEFRQSFNVTQGLLLVTGPTGSGKTTTLYGIVSELNDLGTKIFTIEDPVEYQLEGILQVPVNVKVGLTFAAGLRALLRQDPDIIMVGEIRDTETAGIAIKAALTGHLVISTLHTSSAPATLARLVDMGVEPYNLSATIQGILAQRLVRKVCRHCSQPSPLTPSIREFFAANAVEPPNTLAEERGCEACNGTGFKGRMGVHEFMPMSENLRMAVNRSAPEHELAALARSEGMMTLMQDGLSKLASKETTLREVLRVLGGNVEGIE